MLRTSRVGLVHASFVAFAIALVGRAAKVQIVDAAMWRGRARQQQVAASPLPAPRGTILDVTGAPLVESRQLVKLAVAPHEVVGDGRRDAAAGMRRLAVLTRALAHAGVSPEWVARAGDTTRKWVEIPGTFLSTDVTRILATRGVHAQPVLERLPAPADGLRRLIGHASDDGEPVDGLEKGLDGILHGTDGRTALLRDAHGVRFVSPSVSGSGPTPGETVELTINRTLQDIAERSLDDAVRQMGATGGDIVMIDPQSGEVRALATRRANPLASVATALTEPYEPGSTLKPFVAARLLDLGRARVDEMMNTHNGKYELNGRVIADDHPEAALSLADVIRFSSNIGIVQFAARLAPGEQYQLLRDLGFGTQTGVPYPGESPGILRPPKQWDAQTAASLAMGYAIDVTPLQLATAYAAIANGGELLEPALVREVRSPDGTVVWRHTRRVVRRVMTEETARTVRGLLRGVVDSGTARGVNLATFDIAGKTGTAKRTEHGRYVAGKYTASFVGLFPAEHPQMVILVKLDNPSKSIYGGTAAAPVVKTVLQAAIAARDASLDRGALAAAPARAARSSAALTDSASAADSLVRIEESGSVPYVYRLDSPKPAAAHVVASRAVPDVNGLPLRRAVYTLHRAGFHVTLGDAGAVGAATGTRPVAGTILPAGTAVTLLLGQ